MYKEIGKWLEEIGFPSGDLNDNPESPLRFPDGAHWRMEISGVERLSTLETLLNEKEKKKIPLHRIVCTAMGATYLTRDELTEFVKLANAAKVETIISPGPRVAWEVGSKSYSTPEGFGSGGKVRGMDNVVNYIRDVLRCINLGFRAFLCEDEGLLLIMNKLREAGKIPADVIFKMGITVGSTNPANMKILENLGADSINPVSDVTLSQLAAMRKVCKVPFDLHVVGMDQQGGQNRMWDVAELARVAAPVYLNIEPGTSYSSMYKLWMKDMNDTLIKEKVNMAKIVSEIMHDTNPNIICSDCAPDDLRVPAI